MFHRREQHFGLHKFSVGRNASRKHRGEGTFHSERYFTRKAADHTVGGLFTYVEHLAFRGSVASVLRLDIRRDQRGAGTVILVDLCLEVGGPLDEGSGKFRIGSRFGEFEQRRCLTRKICSTQHMDKPRHSGECITREQGVSFRGQT